jgi:class 3 adenylate cyclase/pimeloyl-ACP methyl ester carboxylesterase
VEDFLDVRYVKTGDGVYIAYATIGSGPIDLVSQIDFPGNIDLDFEDPLSQALYEALASFGRVIVHDRRGTGLSSRNVAAPNLETRVSDLEAVLDAVGSERPVLLGPFESGAPNVLFAATRPERVHSIVWYEPTARSVWMPDYPWGMRPEHVEAELQSLAEFGTLEYGQAFVANSAALGNLFPEGWERIVAREARNTCTPDVAEEIHRIWFETDVRAVLPAVQAPALLISHEERKDDLEEAKYVASLMPRAEVQLLPGETWTADGFRTSAEFIRRFIGIEPPPTGIDTVLSTVLFTDIVGSTQKQASLGDRAWKDLIARHHTIVRDGLRRWRGTENDTVGDGFYATFDGPARAIRCALEVAERVRDLGIEIRAGLHTGECQLIEGKCAGLSVSIGARVAAHADRSEVFVSQTVKDLVAGSGFTFSDAGEHELKGVPDRWRLYRVVD